MAPRTRNDHTKILQEVEDPERQLKHNYSRSKSDPVDCDRRPTGRKENAKCTSKEIMEAMKSAGTKWDRSKATSCLESVANQATKKEVCIATCKDVCEVWKALAEATLKELDSFVAVRLKMQKIRTKTKSLICV